jgi:ABC-2 type transport system permease protein
MNNASLQRIKRVASREFFSTVSSKAFIFGILFTPIVLVLLVLIVPRILAQQGKDMAVEVALVDQSSEVAQTLRTELTADAIAARRAAVLRATAEQVAPGAAGMTPAAPVEKIPAFTVKELAATATLDAEKSWLTAEDIGATQRRALVIIPAEAVTRTGGRSDYSGYQLYVPRNVPEDAESALHEGLRQALTTVRLRSTGIDAEVVTAATRVIRPRTVVVSPDGKQQRGQALNRMLPFIMGILLMMFVMMGGQALMTSTIEEKGSRVVEVLLAAVSPLELMWGKLLGQLGVGLIAMAMYVGLGVVALLYSAMFGLIDPMLLVYLLVFFLITYLVFGALMLAIGAAVNQAADAQSLLGPIMLLLMLSYALTPVVGRNPDAPIAVISSFIPPINAFAMLARLASSSPPPVWQVLLSMLVGILGACAAVWFAAKVYRVGLLMHGKPPNLATLVKWARQS